MVNPINVAFADDHSKYRESLVQFIQTAAANIKISIQGDNGRDLINKIEKQNSIPDVCLLDINMPVLNGYDTIAELKHRWPEIKVLVFSMHDNEFAILHMLRCGARGYVLKHGDPNEIINGINSIYEFGYYNTDLVGSVAIRAASLPEINLREIEFLKHCCLDLRYQEIAKRMNLTIRAVEWYRDTLFKKLHVKTRAGLALFAVQFGLVPLNTHS